MLHFEEVYIKGDTGDEYEAGFALAKDWPDHILKRLTSDTSDILFMLYQGEEPGIDQITAGLKEQNMELWIQILLDDINDELDQQMDNALHNT